jgi:hypothetical protein
MMDWIQLIQDKEEVAGWSAYHNECSGSMKDREFLGSYQLFRDSAPWS